VIKQYEDAEQQIPAELKPENQSDVQEEQHESEGNAGGSDRSWFSYMTFGIFD